MSVGNAFFAAVFEVVYAVLDLYVWAVILGAILSWLAAFEVINPYNRFVRAVIEVLRRITEPLLRPIRQRMPDLGGLDLSPLVLIFILYFFQAFIRRLVF